MRNILVEKLDQRPVSLHKVEFVERKGVGHPDYIADSVSENFSLFLSKLYLERYGTILHHNVDKALVIGGQANPKFGGGEILEPITIILAGRATTYVRKDGCMEPVPVGRIAVEAVRSWIGDNFRYLDPEKHVVVEYRIGKGSADLAGLFEAGLKEKVPLANDTSFGVSFAPLTTTEKMVFEVERLINSKDFKKRIPESGEDVKVMGLRNGDKLGLTVAVALISHLVDDLDHYISVKEEIADEVYDFVVKKTDMDVEVNVNTADNPEKGIVYITVSGTSAEHGDDGSTGRGNRVNGLITPSRPMSLEATAGKNPVSHVGKIYNVLARRVAERVAKVDGVAECYVKVLSQIGKPIDRPWLANIQLVMNDESKFNNASYEAKVIMEEELENITELTRLIIEKRELLY